MIDRYIEALETISDIAYAYATEETLDGFIRALYNAGYIIIRLEDLR